MSSSTRLLVLGVVKLFQPVHGYEVRRELLSWRAQEWASIQPGSIYNALKTLTRDGLLEVASTDQVGGRPERTTYRLTHAGQEEFQTLLREQWWAVHPPVDPLMAAVSFLGETSRAEAIAALEHRAAHIHGMVRAVEFAIENHDVRESPDHVREMMRLMTARVSAELAWSQHFIERLRRGEYATRGDPPWQPPSRSDAARGPRNERLPSARPRRRAPRTTADRSAPAPADRAPPTERTDRRARPAFDRADRGRRRRDGATTPSRRPDRSITDGARAGDPDAGGREQGPARFAAARRNGGLRSRRPRGPRSR